MSKKNTRLDLVKASVGVKKTRNLNSTMDDIRERISAMGNIENLQDDISFTHLICNYVENVTAVTLTGPEKKEHVVQLITSKFPALNNDKDRARIAKDIDFLCSIGTVAKVAATQVVKKGLKDILFKHLS